ncbi:MAG: ATP-binding protein [Rickettsiales bacterium]|nr:ATP-binding protein [Rickettsiales bacterium]
MNRSRETDSSGNPNNASIAFGVLLKSLMLISLPPMIVLSVFVVLGILSLPHMLLAYIVILLTSTIFVYPFLGNIAALTAYVDMLAKDKRVQAPTLQYLSVPFDLSEALEHLQRSWEVKKQQMESVITEREILVDTLPDILIMINDDQQIVRTNRAARAIFGQNLAQKPLDEVIKSPSLMDSVNSVITDLKGREVEFRIEEPVIRDFLAIIERFPVPSGGGISTIITMNDITELKSVEQMRADFVANASHEIRTPLASIRGFIETLMGPAKDDEQARTEFLQIMLDQADRMQQLINDLLSLSKIEMNANTVPISAVELDKVIRKQVEQLKHPADQKQMKLVLDIHDNLPQAKGDANELAQVVHNLVGNAIKYGYANSDVTVRAKVTSELPSDSKMRNQHRVILMSVQDQGEGIPKQHLPRLMERFYRVDSARTREIGGTGLGLAIVKGIVNRHRGAITVDSIEGEGTTFSVYLPIYED